MFGDVKTKLKIIFLPILFLGFFSCAKTANAVYRDSTTNSGTSTTPSVAVPTGVQSGDIVILVATIDASAADFETADWPSGFTELAETDNTLDGQSTAIGWKRLTGSDSGSYTFGSVGASGDWICQAYAISGRHASNNPVATSNTNNSGNSSPVSVTATGVTAVAGDDLLWVSAPDVSATGIGNGHTNPTNYTEEEDAENGWSNLSGAIRQNVSAGATGNITGTFSLTGGTSAWTAFLVRVPVAAVAVSAALTGTITSSTTESDIRAGGKTIILTLTNDTWVASGSAFDNQRQNIINGIDSAQSEATGWDTEVKAKQGVSGVVRTSDTIVTITLDAQVAYNITANETITATIPATALTGGVQVEAAPTFTVSSEAATNVYYSVGQNTTDHKTCAGGDCNTYPLHATVAGSTITFDTGQTDVNFGVGDAVTYGGNTCYISGKTSFTVWKCVSATGSAPTSSSGVTVTSIAHVFSSLDDAINGADGASYLNTTNLTTANVVLNIPCYFDTGADTEAVVLSGWTTGANNYIKIYTPSDTSTEVNQSQRHQGKWDNGKYRLEVTGPSSIDNQDTNSYVRFEGLQIKNTYTTANTPRGLLSRHTSGEVQVSNSILWGNHSGSVTSSQGITWDYGGNFKIRNNIIYNFLDNGIDVSGTSYVYNNTIIDCGGGIKSGGSVVAKNNIIKGSGNTNAYIGTFASGTDYNATDGTDAIGEGLNNRVSQTFTFLDATNKDFHLSSTDAGAKNAGADLATDSNLPVTTDIDGQTRPTGSSIVDIGADERIANVYYSVSGGGDAATDRKVAATVGISNGVMSFSAPQTGNIGVGDEVIYGSGTKAYISGKIDTSHWNVATKLGDPASDIASGTTLTSIKRVWNSVSAAEAGAPGVNFLNSLDLTGTGTILNIPCYYDTGEDYSYLEIDGWTTSSAGYIRVYTPNDTTTEANISQRHSGVWKNSAYSLNPSSPGSSIYINSAYTRVIGLQTIGHGTNAILVLGEESDISHNIVSSEGIMLMGIRTYGSNTKIYNNIVYSINQNDISTGIFRGKYVYNNTVYGCDTGILSESSETIAKNNIAYGNTDNYSGLFNGGANNLSGPGSDAQIPGLNNQNGVTVTFVNAANKNFHLSSTDTGARDHGIDLSNDLDDGISFSFDIENQSRPYNSTWDIGADEYVLLSTKNVYYSVGQSTADLKTDSPTLRIFAGVATFSTAQTGNIGVGDRITYNGGYVFISGKISPTQWNVVTALGATPDNVTSDTSLTSIKREFTTLSGAEAGAENSSHLNSTDLVATNVTLNFPCYYDSAADSNRVLVSGWTTGEDNYIKIYTPNNILTEANNSQRHSGVWNTGSYRLESQIPDFEYLLSVEVNYVRVLGLQLSSHPSTAGHSQNISFTPLSYNNRMEVGYSILKAGGGDLDNYTTVGVFIYGNYGQVYIYNNVFYDLKNRLYGAIFQNSWMSSFFVYNNTFQNCYLGLSLRDVEINTFAKNNLFKSVTIPCGGDYTVLSAGSDYNATNNSSLGCTVSGNGNTHDRLNQTIAFQNEGADNFHLSPADTGARTFGADLSADSNLSFSDDIDGQNRFGHWDIGADENSLTTTEIQSNEQKINSMTANLVGYWSFDGQDISGAIAYDRSTGGHNGTISAATPVSGKRGQALDFNGTSAYVSPGNVGSGIKTISFWLKADTITSRKIMDFDGTDQIEIDGSSHILATSFPGTTVVYVDGAVASTIDANWHFITITDTTGVNGSAVDIGRVSSGYFDGKIDEVRMYSTVLTATQVGDLYRTGQEKINMSLTDKLTSGLVGMWSFDGPDVSGTTAYDRSPVGTNHGTISGATPVMGKKGQGMGFDGSNRVSVNNKTIIMNDATVCAWIRPAQGDQYASIINNGDFEFNLRVANNPIERLELTSNHDGTTINSDNHAINLGEWQYVCATRLSNGNATFYVDGTQSGTANQNSGTPTNDTIWGESIGARPDGVMPFSGSIDEVRIYNRILSADEIGNLYRSGHVSFIK